MTEEFKQPENEQENDFTQGLNYPPENEKTAGEIYIEKKFRPHLSLPEQMPVQIEKILEKYDSKPEVMERFKNEIWPLIRTGIGESMFFQTDRRSKQEDTWAQAGRLIEGLLKGIDVKISGGPGTTESNLVHLFRTLGLFLPSGYTKGAFKNYEMLKTKGSFDIDKAKEVVKQIINNKDIIHSRFEEIVKKWAEKGLKYWPYRIEGFTNSGILDLSNFADNYLYNYLINGYGGQDLYSKFDPESLHSYIGKAESDLDKIREGYLLEKDKDL